MKTITYIATFDDDKYFLGLLKGYCYEKHITVTTFEFNIDGIKQLERLNPILIMVPLNWISLTNKKIETDFLRRTAISCGMRICGLNITGILPVGLPRWLDVIINNPSNMDEIDNYFKKIHFSLDEINLIDDSRFLERRSFIEKEGIKPNKIKVDDRVKKISGPDYQNKSGNFGLTEFQIDSRNKCLFLYGEKVCLTPKEFDFIELLLTDIDRVFMSDEIINHLWPESNRATKADLYQYIYLLRKKIEKDFNHPQWIMNIKGFGYKLNIGY